MPDKDYEPLLRQIGEDAAVTRTNVAHLTELMHDFHTSTEVRFSDVNARLDEHGRRISSLETTRASDTSVKRAARWVLASILAVGGAVAAWRHG